MLVRRWSCALSAAVGHAPNVPWGTIWVHRTQWQGAHVSTYNNAMKNFMETYQEGLKDQLQEKVDGGNGGGGRQQ